ncbi:hypothetical protein [Rhizobium sp. SRDI969]|uniref:hypothetical protein n=1 Tax=Rhizobium sp. SRDI969 TaxID=3138252 RepID=UPI0021A4ABAC|nr:hypothetical protein [Rhizobium leguminosarum]UWM84833.1 hypothetical protein N2A41_28945 [Rhizobium leguminosarum bv. viciae]
MKKSTHRLALGRLLATQKQGNVETHRQCIRHRLTTLSALGMSAAFTARAEEPKRGGTAIIHMMTEQRVFKPALRASIAVYAISGKSSNL